jgi:hypothetical protein
VNAVASAVVPLDALAPIVLGAIALRFGVPVVVALLALAPLGVGLMAVRDAAR